MKLKLHFEGWFEIFQKEKARVVKDEGWQTTPQIYWTECIKHMCISAPSVIGCLVEYYSLVLVSVGLVQKFIMSCFQSILWKNPKKLSCQPNKRQWFQDLPMYTRIHECSNPLYKMVYYLQVTYAHPPVNLKSSLDYLYQIQ